jgi:hypothetical protein
MKPLPLKRPRFAFPLAAGDADVLDLARWGERALRETPYVGGVAPLAEGVGLCLSRYRDFRFRDWGHAFFSGIFFPAFFLPAGFGRSD